MVSWNRRKQRQICSKIPETRGNSRKVVNAQNFFVIESSSKILETRGNARKVSKRFRIYNSQNYPFTLKTYGQKLHFGWWWSFSSQNFHDEKSHGFKSLPIEISLEAKTMENASFVKRMDKLHARWKNLCFKRMNKCLQCSDRCWKKAKFDQELNNFIFNFFI